jgi:hypothetical protein
MGDSQKSCNADEGDYILQLLHNEKTAACLTHSDNSTFILIYCTLAELKLAQESFAAPNTPRTSITNNIPSLKHSNSKTFNFSELTLSELYLKVSKLDLQVFPPTIPRHESLCQQSTLIVGKTNDTVPIHSYKVSKPSITGVAQLFNVRFHLVIHLTLRTYALCHSSWQIDFWAFYQIKHSIVGCHSISVKTTRCELNTAAAIGG